MANAATVRLFFFPEGGWVKPKRGCLLTLTYYAFPRWYEFGERRWNDIDRGKPKNSEKNLSTATLSTTNPTWIDPGANPDLRGERQATNDLSHGTARQLIKCHKIKQTRWSIISVTKKSLYIYFSKFVPKLISDILLLGFREITNLLETLCSLAGTYRRFRGEYCLHHQGDE
jgi:hypothetical protein